MQHNKAFSLLELSIVLVIIGLIAGGIVAGASMIRAAELRSVITEFNQYQTAVNTFRDKYLGLPGDLRNAEAFWGSMTNCGAASPSGTGTQTCNGDGDGQLLPPATGSQTGEYFTFWQQLANAGLIAGTYTAIAGSVSHLDHILDENAPASKLGGAGWGIKFATSSDANWFDGKTGNTYRFGARFTGDGELKSAITTATETWNVDKKIDDGMPATP